MTEVASLELCKELYSLSEWDDFTSDFWGKVTEKSQPQLLPRTQKVWTYRPTYDLGYLLRKLPMKIEQPTTTYFFQMSEAAEDGKWQIDYRDEYGGQYTAVVADTPENAACKLAIELFKQGVLKRGAS